MLQQTLFLKRLPILQNQPIGFQIMLYQPRVGGKIRLSFYKEKSTEPERDHLQEGTIKEFIPGKKVSYTWQFKYTPELTETIVTCELEETDDKKTRVVLNHSGLTGKEIGKLSSAEFDNGWTYFLDRLENIVRLTIRIECSDRKLIQTNDIIAQ